MVKTGAHPIPSRGFHPWKGAGQMQVRGRGRGRQRRLPSEEPSWERLVQARHVPTCYSCLNRSLKSRLECGLHSPCKALSRSLSLPTPLVSTRGGRESRLVGPMTAASRWAPSTLSLSFPPAFPSHVCPCAAFAPSLPRGSPRLSVASSFGACPSLPRIVTFWT